MKLLHDNSDKELIRLHRNPFFSKVTDYLYENQDVTLRQLTAVFPEKGFIKFLEACIEAGVILREQRRYQLRLPVYTGLDSYNRDGMVQENALVSLATASFSEICQWYQQQFSNSNNVFEPYFVTDEVKLAQVAKISNEKLAVWSVNTLGPDKRDLPGYFEANCQLLEPEVFDELRRLVGDVDEEYFLGQVGWVISRVLRGKESRPSIFLTALCETEVLSKNGEQDYQLAIPYFSEKKYENSTKTSEIVTSKSHFIKNSLYSEVCQRYCEGFAQWLELK